MSLLRVADGKIAEEWQSLTEAGLLSQLGILPGSSSPELQVASGQKVRPGTLALFGNSAFT